jgi:tripartite-type tricarboxylate transporter receptor subunit TctC
MLKRIPLLIAFAAACAAAPAMAQTYPSKPITIIVPFPPGGANDTTARLIGQKLDNAFGQRVVVENKPGATGAIGLQAVARAPADGYTLVMATGSSLATNPAVSKVPYDPVRDFTPISMVALDTMALAVHAAVPARNVPELIALAKAKPGEVTFASFGIGSIPHLGGELLSSMAGVKMLHVPYKGGTPATTDLAGGQVSWMFNSILAFAGPVQEGRVRIIATAGASRSPALPDVPTVAESGFPGFEAASWYALLGPAALPPEIVARLSDEVLKALKMPDVRERLTALSLEPRTGTPEELSQTLQRDFAKWKKVVADAGITVE